MIHRLRLHVASFLYWWADLIWPLPEDDEWVAVPRDYWERSVVLLAESRAAVTDDERRMYAHRCSQLRSDLDALRLT